MASLEALRKRREIPVSVRVRSTSLGRDRASILNDSVDPKRNDETLTPRGTRNILDLRSRSSSVTRDASLGDTNERSRRSISSMHESHSNSSDRSMLEKFLHMKERRDSSSTSKERRRSRGETDMEVDETNKDGRSQCSRPQSLALSGNSTQSWNGGPYVGDMKDEGGSKVATDTEVSTKKKGRRISRFLRPDFFDTPREESIFAKRKDVEADALAESERKQREQHVKSGFLHSLEKRLDKLRGGERSKKMNPPDAESAVTCEELGSVAQGCLTSTKLAAEVRKAKSLGPDEVPNSDGAKKGFASSRVDRAIISLLQREKGKSKKEVSESGLIKRAVGIDERGCPSKSRSSGELAHLSVTGGSLLGKSVALQKNSLPTGGEVGVNGMGTENGVGAKFSSKVNSMLGLFRRNEVEQVPVSRTSRLRRTQSVAYDKSDDILSAISGCDALKNDESKRNAKSETEPKSPQLEGTIKVTNKTEKVKKSSKPAKEKLTTAKSKTCVQKDRKATTVKIDKENEGAPKESTNEKLPQSNLIKKVTDSKKDKNTASTLEKKSDVIYVKLTKPSTKETAATIVKPSSNFTTAPVADSLIHTPSNEKLNKSKVQSQSNVDTSAIKMQVSPLNESRLEMKELGVMESPHSATVKQLDRTATQDSLDSSWSAFSDGVGDGGGEMREMGKVSRQEGVNMGATELADSDILHLNCLNSPSPTAMDDSEERGSGRGELGGGDDDSEESVGDRIRRKSFYCRFNEVPSRRKSRVGRKSSASSLLYSASDHSWSPLDLTPDHKSHRRSSGSGRSSGSVSPGSAMEGNSLDSPQLQLSYRTNAESKKPELTSMQSRDDFSPPPLPYRPTSAIYRRSSTSPYQDRLPPADPLLHSTLLSRGLRPTSSATSLTRSNSSSRASELEDEGSLTRKGEEGGPVQYIPSPLSPSSSMCNSYHNGISPSHIDEVSLEQDRKARRSRKLGVPSLSDGITTPSPTHRKYNNRYSSYCSSDGLTSSSGVVESRPSSLTSERISQAMNPIGLPPLGISLSNKMRAMRNSAGHE